MGNNQMQPAMFNQMVLGATTSQTDTITVQLWTWDGINAAVFIEESKTILMTDGTSSSTFSTAPAGDYYIAIRHRNSIPTWSSIAVTMSSTPASYNFTTLSSSALGDNMALDGFGDNVWTFFNGDINQDDFVDIFDYNDLDADNFNFVGEVYVPTDLNGDGFVDIFDYNLIDANNFSFIGSVHP